MAARWETHGKAIPVWDFTSDFWRESVQATVDDFNASLPPEVPRLTYVPMGEMACDALPENGRVGGISVCSAPVWPHYGEVKRSFRHDRVVSAKVIQLEGGDVVKPKAIMCHEFTHAVFDAPDSPDPTTRPHENESCVQGRLDHLGAWDIAYAAQVYGARGKSKHRHHR